MFIVLRQCLVRVGERSLMVPTLAARAHHPLIDKVQSLIGNKPSRKEPEKMVVAKAATAKSNSTPSPADLHHERMRLQEETEKAQTDSTNSSAGGPAATASPACSPDSPANVPDCGPAPLDASPPPPGPGESMLEQLSMVPQWTTGLRPSPSPGGDGEVEREESCREELRGVLRDLHNYR